MEEFFEPLPEFAPSAEGAVAFRDLDPEEKPREKAFTQGMAALTDAELLAILLGSGTAGKSVLDLAREILHDNQNHLRLVARLSIAELTKKYRGVGRAKATLLAAAIAFGERCSRDLMEKDPQITCSTDVFRYMAHHMCRLNHEEFWVLHLSRANRVTFAERLSRGGTTSTAVDVKLLAKSAIDHLSSALVLVHNHPSGNLVPSAEDDALTRRIQQVAPIIDVRILDHIIIGPSSHYSYADNSRL